MLTRGTATGAGASVATGVLLFLSCADFDIWPLTWFAFLPMLWAMRGQTTGRAVAFAWLAGVVANGGGFYWINGLLIRFGHLPMLVSVPLFLLLCVYQAVVFAAFAYFVTRIRAAFDLPMALVAPVVMTALELVVPFLFPWYLAITQAWVVPVIQIAELTGPLGVTFLLLLVNGALWDLWERRGAAWKPALVAAVTVAASLAFGFVRIGQVEARRSQATHRKIGMVQANVGIMEKGSPKLAEIQHRLHLRLSRDLERRGAELIVWPESSYPYFYFRDMQHDWPEGHPARLMKDLQTPVLFGTVTVPRGTEEVYNSAMLVRPDGRLDGPYDKNYRLLFGEYLPFYEELNIRRWIPESSNFQPSDEIRLFEVGDIRLAPLICYEDIIPSFGRRMYGLNPNLLVNLTNDAWFGDTSEPWEHMALSVYRAVEYRLDLVRSVNTGVTSFIDATGRVRQTTGVVNPEKDPTAEPMTLLAEVALLEPVGFYGRVGHGFGWLNLLGLIGMFGLAWRKQRDR